MRGLPSVRAGEVGRGGGAGAQKQEGPLTLIGRDELTLTARHRRLRGGVVESGRLDSN